MSQQENSGAQPVIGCTMRNGTMLELLDDGTLRVRLQTHIGGDSQTINLGSARLASAAMKDALDSLDPCF
jgi:hypothetical protein